jgi:hypothetical protein
MTPQTILFEGENVYILKELIEYDRAFFVGCNKNPRKAIKNKNVPSDQYWYASYSKLNNIWSLSHAGATKANLLISEKWVHNNVPKYTGNFDVYKYKPLPQLLLLTEEEKFRDFEGNIYEVQVRGEKTKESIRFKCSDILELFKMKNDNIRHSLDKTDYEVFANSCENTGGCERISSFNPVNLTGLNEEILSHPPNTINKRGKQVVTFLTYNGLLKTIFSSRSNVAYRFQDWATNIIYAAQFGTTPERIDAACDIIGINAQLVRNVLSTCISTMPCVYLFNVGKISELRKHYEELKPYKKGFLFKWGRTNNLKRRTGEHIKNYGNLLDSTLRLKYFSPVDNMYEVDAENEIRQYFHSNAISFKNHKELIILDRTEIADARKFYEDVYEKFSSEADKLLGRNKELEHNAEYTKEIIKCKNERIHQLNKECAWLRSEMISFQEREKKYKEELSEMMEQLALSQKLHEETIKSHQQTMEELTLSQKSHQETIKSHQETIKQLTTSEENYRKCQDVLCEIALLTPDERNKLHNLVKTTRIKLDPFLG